MKIFAERLRELRQEEKLSTKKMGEKIGFSDATISRWENNLADPPIESLKKIAEYFNVSSDFLIGLED